MRYTALAAAVLAAGTSLTAPAQAGGICDPGYLIECRPVAGHVAPRGYRQAYVAVPQASHRPVVTGDPFVGGSGYVRDVPAFPLGVQAPGALQPVPYVWGYVTQPAALPQDPPPAIVHVQVPTHGYVPRRHATGLK